MADPDYLTEAKAAITNAQAVRAHHRKRTMKGSPQREADIRLALARLRDSMKPLKSEIGRFQFEHLTTVEEDRQEDIRETSLQIQAERRKLWKMQKRRPKEIT
jgi:hypothetical protein